MNNMASHSAQIPQQQMPMQPQFVYINSAQSNVSSRPMLNVRYFKSKIAAVKGLTLAQLVLGLTVFILHVVTTAINDHLNNLIAELKDKYVSYYFLDGFVDNGATGVWVGLLTVIAASIGVASYKQQKKSLIVTHLVLNVILIIAYPVLMVTLSGNMGRLLACRNEGESYYRRSYYNYDYHYDSGYGRYGSTTTQKPFYLYGEEFSGSSGTFYCRHAIFKAWVALDAIMLVCAVGQFAITMGLLINNSMAVCGCCRRTGCCGSCCCRSCYDPDDEADHVVSYHAQPRMTPMQMQPVPQLQVMPQVHGQPAAINYQYMQQPFGAATPNFATPVALSSQTAAPAVPSQGAGSNSEAKWEELPPEYASVLQNNSSA
ncbi:uncharacterized protein [Watersipora subatra]|uniref:uncharacterized protein isoform X1 n=2 Tax=Watersipora subatra TaxID=2589382 RepID=UPI00355BF172